MAKYSKPGFIAGMNAPRQHARSPESIKNWFFFFLILFLMCSSPDERDRQTAKQHPHSLSRYRYQLPNWDGSVLPRIQLKIERLNGSFVFRVLLTFFILYSISIFVGLCIAICNRSKTSYFVQTINSIHWSHTDDARGSYERRCPPYDYYYY